MADITAKRGPRDPSEGLNSQGIANQAMLQSFAREQQYELQKRAKKKSTWDSIVGGIGDVINIGKGVMDIANSYEDLQVKDEQIKRSELMRQQQELNLEASKQQMGVQSIQNEINLKELKTDNEFVDTVYDYKKNNDDDGLVKYVFSNSKSAAKNSPLVRYLAQQYEKDGNQDVADALYIAAASGNKQQQINSTYGKQSDSTSSKAANPAQQRKYNNYKASVDSVSDILTNTDNIDTVVKLLGGKSNDMAADLMTKCVFMEASNTANKNLDTKAYNTTMSVDPNTNLSTQQPATGGKNIQYLDITCPASDNPDDVVTGRIVYDADKEVTRPVFTANGIYKGTETIPAGTAIADIIAQNKAYLKSIGKANKYAPVITTEKVLKEQASRRESAIVDTPKRPLTEQEVKTGLKSTSFVSDLAKTDVKLTAKQEKYLKQEIRKRVDRIKDLPDPRSEVLKKAGFTEEDYNKLKGAQKIKFLNELLTELVSRGKDITKEELEELNKSLRSNYDL